MSVPTEDATRMSFLLRRLVALAGDMHDQLSVGDWEGAQPIQEEYDEAFATFQHALNSGQSLGSEHARDLERLRDVHAENLTLAQALQVRAGVERGIAANASKLGGYAPMGAQHVPGPRYLDGSA